MIRFATILILLGLSGCAGGIEETNPEANLNAAADLKIVATSPQNGGKDVALNATLTLTFNQEIEKFFPAHRQNFELWTADGSRVPGNATVNGTLVELEGYPGIKVSQVSIRPPGRYFLPNTDYVLIWREAPPKGSTDDATLKGIHALYGTPPDRLASGSIKFRTGSSFNNSARPEIEVLAMAPGKAILSAADSAPSLLESIDGYLSLLSNPRITMLMTEPVMHPQVDLSVPPSANMDWQTICSSQVVNNCFHGVQIGVIDANTLTNEFLTNMTAALNNPAAWMSFLNNNFYNRLPGKVKTDYGRRQIVFELAPGATYPDTLAQVVVVILTGWLSIDSYPGVPAKTLKNNIFAGAFVHYSGFELPSGFPNVYQTLQGGNPQ